MDRAELKRLYLLLEEMNHFFHQPMHFEEVNDVEEFAQRIHPELKDMYYRVVWDWLPKDLQDEFINR